MPVKNRFKNAMWTLITWKKNPEYHPITFCYENDPFLPSFLLPKSSKDLSHFLRSYGLMCLPPTRDNRNGDFFLWVNSNLYGQVSYRKHCICHQNASVHQKASIFLFICRINEFEEAVNFFTWALKINPCFLDAYVGRGNSYMECGHAEATKQAQKDFLKALHINPAYIKARISFGYNLQVT